MKKIKAGEAYLEIGTRGSLAGLRRVGRQLASFTGRVVKAGAAISVAFGGAMAAATASFVRSTADMDKLAKQTGLTVEQISRLQHAAKRLDIDPDDMSGAIEELNIRMGETIQEGTGPMAEAFKKLGLNAKDLAKLPVAEQIGKIGEALKGLPREQKGFLTDEIFGGDGFKIIPLLDQGAAGIRNLANEADRLGTTVTAGQSASARVLLDTWNEAKATVSGLIRVVVAEFAPAITAGIDTIMPKIREFFGYFKNNGIQSFAQEIKSTFSGVMSALGMVQKGFLLVKLGMGSILGLATKLMGSYWQLLGKIEERIRSMASKLGLNIDVDSNVSGSIGDALKLFSDGLMSEMGKTVESLKKIDAGKGLFKELDKAFQQNFDARLAEQDRLKKQQEYMSDAANQGPGNEGKATGTALGDAVGTFNATAAANIGRSGGIQERILDENKRMREELERIRRQQAEQRGVVWAGGV